MLVDGSCIPFYGVVQLTGRVRNQAIQEMFIVNRLKEDAILRMPFLKRHKCHIDFSKSVVVMAGCELTCVDNFGHPFVGSVQVAPSTARRLRVVEGAHKRIQITSCLNQINV